MVTVILNDGQRIELNKAADAQSEGGTVHGAVLRVRGAEGKDVALFRYSEIKGWIIGEDYGVQ